MAFEMWTSKAVFHPYFFFTKKSFLFILYLFFSMFSPNKDTLVFMFQPMQVFKIHFAWLLVSLFFFFYHIYIFIIYIIFYHIFFCNDKALPSFYPSFSLFLIQHPLRSKCKNFPRYCKAHCAACTINCKMLWLRGAFPWGCNTCISAGSVFRSGFLD